MFIFHVACQALFGLCQTLTKDFQLAKGLQSKCFSSDLTKAKDHQRWGALAFYSDVMFVWVSLKEVIKSSCEKLRYKKSSCGRVCVRACVSVYVRVWACACVSGYRVRDREEEMIMVRLKSDRERERGGERESERVWREAVEPKARDFSVAFCSKCPTLVRLLLSSQKKFLKVLRFRNFFPGYESRSRIIIGFRFSGFFIRYLPDFLFRPQSSEAEKGVFFFIEDQNEKQRTDFAGDRTDWSSGLESLGSEVCITPNTSTIRPKARKLHKKAG